MAVLLLLVSLVAPGITQNTYYSYCPTPSPSEQLHENDVLNYPYINIVSNNGYDLDNTCHLYYPIADTKGSYLARFNGVQSNGSDSDPGTSYIVNFSSGNISTYSSPFCSFTQKTINVGKFVVGIRQITSYVCLELLQPVVVGYPCPQYGSASDLPLIRRVLSDNGVGCPDLIVLPRRYPFNCPTLKSTNTGSTVNCPGQCRGSGYPDY